MEPTRFDQLTYALAAGASRRQVILAFGGAILSRLTLFEGTAARLLAQPGTPTPEALAESAPIFVSPNPIPIGNGRYLVNGTIVSLELEAAPFVEETPAVPITIEEETVYIDPSNLAEGAGPGATPMAGGVESGDGGLETICGFDDSQDVELYDGTLGVSQEFVTGHQSPVGLIRWNSRLRDIYTNPGTVNALRWCSGTLITPELFLTAGHCFSQNPPGWVVPRINGTDSPIPRPEIARNMHVDFRYQLTADGNDQEWESFAIVELVEDRMGDLDYAIVRLENNPGITYGLAGIAPADVAEEETLCIMGHPAGFPKRIEAGPTSRLGVIRSESIEYDSIDTRGGNSGSGILADTHGLIVGIHTNGGCCEEGTEIDCSQVQPGRNWGVRISALLNASPILRSLAAGETTSA